MKTIENDKKIYEHQIEKGDEIENKTFKTIKYDIITEFKKEIEMKKLNADSPNVYIEKVSITSFEKIGGLNVKYKVLNRRLLKEYEFIYYIDNEVYNINPGNPENPEKLCVLESKGCYELIICDTKGLLDSETDFNKDYLFSKMNDFGYFFDIYQSSIKVVEKENIDSQNPPISPGRLPISSTTHLLPTENHLLGEVYHPDLKVPCPQIHLFFHYHQKLI